MTSNEPTLQELLAHVPGWTGRIVKTQEEADAAAIELRNDGAPKHYLIVTPIEHIDIDFAVPINWLLLSTPPWPVIADARDVFGLIKPARATKCPIYMSQKLVGRPTPQCPGMQLTKEFPTIDGHPTAIELVEVEVFDSRRHAVKWSRK
jgi:hypothetical protein